MQLHIIIRAIRLSSSIKRDMISSPVADRWLQILHFAFTSLLPHHIYHTVIHHVLFSISSNAIIIHSPPFRLPFSLPLIFRVCHDFIFCCYYCQMIEIAIIITYIFMLEEISDLIPFLPWLDLYVCLFF